MSVKYKFVNGDNFNDAYVIEKKINEMAKEGWRFSFLLNRAWIFFEREISAEEEKP